VGIEVKRDADRCVAEPFLRDLGMNAGQQELSRVAVA